MSSKTRVKNTPVIVGGDLAAAMIVQSINLDRRLLSVRTKKSNVMRGRSW
jgi:hypothetical protein